jgi:hypothetical protein
VQEAMSAEEKYELALDMLKWAFSLVHQYDTEQLYTERNGMIMVAMTFAVNAGIPVGVRIDAKEPEWPVVFFELPTGQVSWHIPQHINEWDGHTTEEKYKRVKRFVESGAEDATNDK